MKKQYFYILFLVAIFIFVLSACTTEDPTDPGTSEVTISGEEASDSSYENESSQAEEDKPTIKIGVLEPQNNPYGAGGRLELLGIKFANEEKPSVSINGIEYQIQLIVSDDLTSRQNAKSAAKKLIKEGVSAVIGCCSGSYSLSAASLLSEANIPLLNISVSPIKLTENYENTFTLTNTDKSIGTRAADYVFKKLKKDSAYILCLLGDDSAEEASFFFTQRSKALGLRTKLKTFDKETADFSVFAAEASGYDSLFVAAPLSYSRKIIEAASVYGVKTVFSTAAWSSEKLVYELRDRDVDLYIASNLKYNEKSERCKAFMNWMGSDADLSEMSEGCIESGIAYGGVDAYNTVYRAIKKASSITGTEIIKQLRKTDSKGITGKISFNENGVRKQKAAIYHLSKNSSTWEKQ